MGTGLRSVFFRVKGGKPMLSHVAVYQLWCIYAWFTLMVSCVSIVGGYEERKTLLS